MQRALQAEEQAGRPCRHLRHEVRAARRRVVGRVEQPAPLVGIGVVLQQGEGDRPAGRRGDLLHPRQLGLLGHQVGGQLEHAAPQLAEHPADAEQLVGRGERPGDGLAVDRAMEQRARRGEAERTGRDALAHDRRHLGDVVRRRRLRSSRRARPSRRRARRRAAPAPRRRSRAAWPRARRDTRESSPTTSGCPRRARCPGCPRHPPSGRSASRDCRVAPARSRRRSCPSRRW